MFKSSNPSDPLTSTLARDYQMLGKRTQPGPEIAGQSVADGEPTAKQIKLASGPRKSPTDSLLDELEAHYPITICTESGRTVVRKSRVYWCSGCERTEKFPCASPSHVTLRGALFDCSYQGQILDILNLPRNATPGVGKVVVSKRKRCVNKGCSRCNEPDPERKIPLLVECGATLIICPDDQVKFAQHKLSKHYPDYKIVVMTRRDKNIRQSVLDADIVISQHPLRKVNGNERMRDDDVVVCGHIDKLYRVGEKYFMSQPENWEINVSDNGPYSGVLSLGDSAHFRWKRTICLNCLGIHSSLPIFSDLFVIEYVGESQHGSINNCDAARRLSGLNIDRRVLGPSLSDKRFCNFLHGIVMNAHNYPTVHGSKETCTFSTVRVPITPLERLLGQDGHQHVKFPDISEHLDMLETMYSQLGTLVKLCETYLQKQTIPVAAIRKFIGDFSDALEKCISEAFLTDRSRNNQSALICEEYVVSNGPAYASDDISLVSGFSSKSKYLYPNPRTTPFLLNLALEFGFRGGLGVLNDLSTFPKPARDIIFSASLTFVHSNPIEGCVSILPEWLFDNEWLDCSPVTKVVRYYERIHKVKYDDTLRDTILSLQLYEIHRQLGEAAHVVMQSILEKISFVRRFSYDPSFEFKCDLCGTADPGEFAIMLLSQQMVCYSCRNSRIGRCSVVLCDSIAGVKMTHSPHDRKRHQFSISLAVQQELGPSYYGPSFAHNAWSFSVAVTEILARIPADSTVVFFGKDKSAGTVSLQHASSFCCPRFFDSCHSKVPLFQPHIVGQCLTKSGKKLPTTYCHHHPDHPGVINVIPKGCDTWVNYSRRRIGLAIDRPTYPYYYPPNLRIISADVIIVLPGFAEKFEPFLPLVTCTKFGKTPRVIILEQEEPQYSISLE